MAGGAGPPPPKGLELVREAASRDPNNPLYRYALGHREATEGNYGAAFRPLRRAAGLAGGQGDLHRVPAANEARYRSRRVLVEAAEATDITAPSSTAWTWWISSSRPAPATAA